MAETVLKRVTRILIRDAIERGAQPSAIVQDLMDAAAEIIPERRRDVASAAALGRQLLLAECLDARGAAKLYSVERRVDPEAVKKAARAGKLIVARGTRRRMLFPIWQFADGGGVLTGIGEILSELRRSPAWSDMLPFTFMLNRTPVLGGKRPIDVLRAGTQAAVVAVRKAAVSTRF